MNGLRLNSIKSRIIFFYIAILGIFLSIVAIFFIFYLKSIVYRPIDDSLLKKAVALDRLISSTTIRFSLPNVYGKRFEIDLSKAQLWIYSSVYSKYYFQLRTLDGKLIEKSKSLGRFILPFDKKMRKFKTVKVDGKYLRLVNYIDKKNQLLIQVAYDVKNEKSMLVRFEIIVFSTLFFLLFVSAVAGFYVSKRALDPIADISKQIKNVTEHSLDTRIDVGEVPDELRGLIESFNILLDRLNRAFKREKQFISDVSHELKTPISVIQMQCEIALRKEREREEYKTALTTINDTVSMMSDLVEKMLMISRLERIDRGTFESVDIGGVISTAFDLLRQKAKDKDLKIVFYQPKERLFVFGDRTLLLEMFVNLIDNSIKYNKKGGEVRVTLGRVNQGIKVEVSDTGLGMDTVETEKIFEEFYRIDKSRSKTKEGFGLGLSIVKKIADIHKAGIFVDTSLSKGTTFTVIFKDTL